MYQALLYMVKYACSNPNEFIEGIFLFPAMVNL